MKEDEKIATEGGSQITESMVLHGANQTGYRINMRGQICLYSVWLYCKDDNMKNCSSGYAFLTSKWDRI